MSESEKKERYCDKKTEQVQDREKSNDEGRTIIYKTDTIISYKNVEKNYTQDLDNATKKLKDEQDIQENAFNELASEKQKYLKIDTITILSEAGLYQRLAALHAIAFNEEKSDGYHPWPYGIFVPDTITENIVKSNNDISNLALDTIKDSQVKGNNYINNLVLDTLNAGGINTKVIANDTIAVANDIMEVSTDSTEQIKIERKFNWSLGNPLFWFIAIFMILSIFTYSFMPSVTKPQSDDIDEEDDIDANNKKNNPSEKELRKKGMLVTYPWFAVVAFVCAICCNTFFNALPYYIFTAVGMIMMLFILIDVSPVFYKMMLADGQYEQYLHKEKSITQDLVRLNFAKSIAKVNESEIGRLAPLIFSKPFKKIKHILTKADNIQKEELGWIVKDRDGNVIETAHESIRIENRDVFDTVLSMKKAIIEASYQAWYRDMRDAIIGMHKPGEPNGGNAPIDDTPDDPNDPSARARRDTGHHTSDHEPFDEENYYGGTTGTSPDYDASSDDPHPETPEDFLNEEDSHLNNPTDENVSDNVSEDDDNDTINPK